jgi:hypothetical protein
MLWRKSWLECKVRLWLCFFMSFSTCLAAMVSIPEQAKVEALASLGLPGGGSYRVLLLLFSSILAPVGAIILAGSGINTQTNWGMLHGFHPSMYFLLSLPVSRERFLRVRVLVGFALLCFWLLATVGMVAVVAKSGFADFPVIHAIRVFPNLLIGTMSFYFLAVFLSSFLDEYWSGMISLTVAGLLCGYSIAGGPWAFNVASFMMRPSLLDLDARAWLQAFLYLLISLCLYVGAWRVVERKEY